MQICTHENLEEENNEKTIIDSYFFFLSRVQRHNPDVSRYVLWLSVNCTIWLPTTIKRYVVAALKSQYHTLSSITVLPQKRRFCDETHSTSFECRRKHKKFSTLTPRIMSLHSFLFKLFTRHQLSHHLDSVPSENGNNVRIVLCSTKYTQRST